MPYKDANKRREKQRELMRTLRANRSAGEPLPTTSCEPEEINLDLLLGIENEVLKFGPCEPCEPAPLSSSGPSDKRSSEPLLFKWTITLGDGSKRKLEMTDHMPEFYKYA